jgi:hypothetical protein
VAVRILIIEDNPTHLELMSYLLRAAGHTLYAAADGAEGIECARRTNPDLIVCDMRLPRLDGYEVAQRLKNDPVLRAVPLVDHAHDVRRGVGGVPPARSPTAGRHRRKLNGLRTLACFFLRNSLTRIDRPPGDGIS